VGKLVPAPTTERGLNRRYLTLVGIQEFAIVLPLAVIVVHMLERGLGLGIVGLAFTVRSVFVVLLEIPTGGLADAIGRKPIALLSQAFTLLSMLALLLVTNVTVALIYAVLQGIGAALHSGALEAWYIDSLKRVNPEANLQKNLARVEIVSALALIGSGLGGVLPTLTSDWNLPWPLAGFGISLFLGVILRLFTLLLTWLIVDEPEIAQTSTVAGFKAVPNILKDSAQLIRSLPIVSFLLGAMFINGVAMISLETFWQPIVGVATGASPDNSVVFGVFGLLTGFAFLAGSVVLLRLSDKPFRGGQAGLAGLAQLLKGSAITLLAVRVTGLEMGVGLSLAYFAIAANNVPHFALLHEAIPDNRRSVMLSVNSLALFLGTAFGSALLGLLASSTGPRLALLLTGLVTIASSLIYWGVARVKPTTPVAPKESVSVLG